VGARTKLSDRTWNVGVERCNWEGPDLRKKTRAEKKNDYALREGKSFPASRMGGLGRRGGGG